MSLDKKVKNFLRIGLITVLFGSAGAAGFGGCTNFLINRDIQSWGQNYSDIAPKNNKIIITHNEQTGENIYRLKSEYQIPIVAFAATAGAFIFGILGLDISGGINRGRSVRGSGNTYDPNIGGWV
jgi:hypothetical protein